MNCVYGWDERRDLVTVTAADGSGLYWSETMTWEEWWRVVERAWVAGQVDLLAFRALAIGFLDGERGRQQAAGGRGPRSIAGRPASRGATV